MTIYVVTSGDYSAYGICGVFTIKANADKYVKMVNACRHHDEAQVEEYEADTINVLGFWFCVLKDDNGVVRINGTKSTDIDVVRRDGRYVTHVFADSQVKARKIGIDRIGQFEAQELAVTEG